MKASYDFFRTPQPKDKDKVSYHARLVVRDTVTTKEIAKRIAKRCTIKEGDLIGALTELARIIRSDISEGYSVHLDEIGSFRISIQSPSVCSTNEIRAENIRFKGIVFTPEKSMLRELRSTRFEKVSHSNRSVNISEIEIDTKLTEFFKYNDYITTAKMRSLCGLSYSTALRRLQNRVKEGRLIHPGHLRAPFYYPVKGNYDINK